MITKSCRSPFASVLAAGAWLGLAGALQAEKIPAGAGAYQSGLPAGGAGPSDRNLQAAVPQVTSQLRAPHPTNGWWSSLIWRFHPENAFSENLHAHPLSFRTNAGGLGMGTSASFTMTGETPTGRGWSAKEFQFPYREEVRVGLVGLAAPETRVDGYGDWTVDVLWPAGAQSLRATIGRGLPMAYFTKTGGDALLTFPFPVEIRHQAGHVLAFSVGENHYAAFGPTGSTWALHGNTARSSLAGRNFFTVAALPDGSAEAREAFARAAHAAVTGSRVSWKYDETAARVTNTYALETVLREPQAVDAPPQALLRHQWRSTSAGLTGWSYEGPRGEMRVLTGKEFSTVRPFHGVLPALPGWAAAGSSGYDPARLFGMVDDLYRQPYAVRWQDAPPVDTYWTGKALCRLAHLLPIAEQVGHVAARDLFLAEIRDRLEAWFRGDHWRGAFYYEPAWGTLIGFPAGFSSDTQLNDHHFHYAYFVMAAAQVGMRDLAWAARYAPMVDLLIRDANSPFRNDPLFPFLRHFDPFAGFNWANGPALFAAGNNQESSSEGMNFATAVLLWGGVTGNVTLRDLGVYLYTTEAAAIREYWFDVDGVNFPPGFGRETLGILWGSGGAYAIWWAGAIEEVHGINFLPVTPGSLYLGHYPEYLAKNQAGMLAHGGSNDAWKDIHAKVTALYDPAAALAGLPQNYTPEWGETRAGTYHWIHSMHRAGRVDPTVTADIAHYGVFLHPQGHRYAAWNPDPTPRRVTFSDGNHLDVPPRTLAWSLGGNSGGGPAPTPAPTPGNEGWPHRAAHYDLRVMSLTADRALVEFRPQSPAGFVDLHYRRTGHGQQNVRMRLAAGVWSWEIGGLRAGDVISYELTYERSGPAYTTSTREFIQQGGTTPAPTPAPTPGGETVGTHDHYSVTASVGNGPALRIGFRPGVKAAFVDLHYRIDGGGQLNVRMAKAGAEWIWEIPNWTGGRVAEWYFTYERSGAAYGTPRYSKAAAQATPTPTTTPTTTPTPTSTSPSPEPFRLLITANGRGGAVVRFEPGWVPAFVDLHYQAAGLSQQNVRMQRDGAAWIFDTGAHRPERYWLTYERGGPAFQTEPRRW